MIWVFAKSCPGGCNLPCESSYEHEYTVIQDIHPPIKLQSGINPPIKLINPPNLPINPPIKLKSTEGIGSKTELAHPTIVGTGSPTV